MDLIEIIKSYKWAWTEKIARKFGEFGYRSKNKTIEVDLSGTHCKKIRSLMHNNRYEMAAERQKYFEKKT